LVAVRAVTVTGLSSAEAPQIAGALRAAALDMTTLHVREGALRSAVSEYPSVERVTADADLTHKLVIRVSERAPVAAIDAGSRRSACSPTPPPSAPPTSTCGCPNGSPQGASDRLRTTPTRPSPQTLNLRSRMARLSTHSRDLGGLQDVLRSYPRVDRNAETP